jgi:hypothetical protein
MGVKRKSPLGEVLEKRKKQNKLAQRKFRKKKK